MSQAHLLERIIHSFPCRFKIKKYLVSSSSLPLVLKWYYCFVTFNINSSLCIAFIFFLQHMNPPATLLHKRNIGWPSKLQFCLDICKRDDPPLIICWSNCNNRSCNSMDVWIENLIPVLPNPGLQTEPDYLWLHWWFTLIVL